jgi:hypothetical protein
MKIDVNNAFTLLSFALMLFGAIYKLARVESNIISKIGALDKKVDIHLVEYKAKVEFFEYRIHDLDNRIVHQGNRVRDWIEQIVAHLHEKAGFILRDRKL